MFIEHLLQFRLIIFVINKFWVTGIATMIFILRIFHHDSGSGGFSVHYYLSFPNPTIKRYGVIGVWTAVTLVTISSYIQLFTTLVDGFFMGDFFVDIFWLSLISPVPLSFLTSLAGIFLRIIACPFPFFDGEFWSLVLSFYRFFLARMGPAARLVLDL